MRKVLSFFMLFCFLIPTIWCVGESISRGDFLFKEGENIDAWSQRIVISAFSQLNFLKELAPSLLYSFGTARHDGIYITKQYLLEDIFVKEDKILESNISLIDDFCKNTQAPVYLCIVPTAIAIKQQELPKMATIYNQKLMISNVYDELSEECEAIDAYSELFAAKEQYLYYRTEPRLTALGGYYVYLALGDSLGFLPYDLDKFKISHTDESVTGSLYKRANNKNFPQDVVSRYEFTQYDCFSVVHKNALAGKKYYSLFPREIESLIDPFELSLGGYSPIMEIVNPMGEKSSLLVLGDEAGTSYLPFLALNYKSITFLDLTRLSVEELLEFKDDSFANVLFCYSADNFLNKKLPSHGMLLSENK